MDTLSKFIGDLNVDNTLLGFNPICQWIRSRSGDEQGVVLVPCRFQSNLSMDTLSKYLADFPPELLAEFQSNLSMDTLSKLQKFFKRLRKSNVSIQSVNGYALEARKFSSNYFQQSRFNPICQWIRSRRARPGAGRVKKVQFQSNLSMDTLSKNQN